ncbi:MAG: hypothetical protein ACI8RZ_000046 [Myxococcota bacterium]|jgi:hypothetical protein
MRFLLPLAAALSLSADARSRSTIDATISQVEGMVWDSNATQTAARHGLSLVNVTWEDTGRSKGSSWGPNISDMTIGVRDSSGALHPMPVLRFDNFNDVTADVQSDRFWLLAGNERGSDLEAIRLDQMLQNLRGFLHEPGSWEGRQRSVWADRDEHVLVSAQACLLPVPAHGEATFTPVIYNYQSYPGDPAVLTIVATREGTSISVVENDGGYMSQPLFFNHDGQRAPFVAERLSDWIDNGGDDNTANTPREQAVQEGMNNVVLVIQVPLKQKAPNQGLFGYGGMLEVDAMDMNMPASQNSRGMEQAVIGHGAVEGPFTELHDLDIERDDQFPVRVTVQFYQATDTGTLTDADAARLRAQIDRVYSDASFVGSLVTEGYTGRPTEWSQPPTTANWASPTWGWLKAY